MKTKITDFRSVVPGYGLQFHTVTLNLLISSTETFVSQNPDTFLISVP